MTVVDSTRVRIKIFTDLLDAFRWLLGAYDHEELERLQRWVDSGAGPGEEQPGHEQTEGMP